MCQDFEFYFNVSRLEFLLINNFLFAQTVLWMEVLSFVMYYISGGAWMKLSLEKKQRIVGQLRKLKVNIYSIF
ncbi:hypothetical protein RC62_3053 [Flavobacterium aquidurense]|uniref:Uncharacterized protein n=1 Tax=Flavobacterium aquidurense TaxID=362413 RepID=A0A0Q0Y442_9FLAO|nr:hypothetical protein RC62_3053 [Flavobacterium aquidurense]